MDSGPNHNNMDQYSRDSLCCAKEQFNEVVDSKAVLSETHVNHDEVHGIDIHPIDHYVNIFYDGDENEVDTKFYNITQNNIDTNFIVRTPKRLHQSNLALVVLINIKAINGMKLTKPSVALCDSGSTDTLIKDSSLPFGCIPAKRKHKQVSTTTQGTYECDEVAYMEHIQLPEFVNRQSV